MDIQVQGIGDDTSPQEKARRFYCRQRTARDTRSHNPNCPYCRRLSPKLQEWLKDVIDDEWIDDIEFAIRFHAHGFFMHRDIASELLKEERAHKETRIQDLACELYILLDIQNVPLDILTDGEDLLSSKLPKGFDLFTKMEEFRDFLRILIETIKYGSLAKNRFHQITKPNKFHRDLFLEQILHLFDIYIRDGNTEDSFQELEIEFVGLVFDSICEPLPRDLSRLVRRLKLSAKSRHQTEGDFAGGEQLSLF